MSSAPPRAVVLLVTLLAACPPTVDVVFVPVTLTLSTAPLAVWEHAGLVEIPLQLSAGPNQVVTARYELVPRSAQDTCLEPDFSGGSGKLSWLPGEQITHIPVRILDDLLAETDETFRVVLSEVTGAVVDGSAELTVSILDDDRTALLDAEADYGCLPNTGTDQSAALQAALLAAAESGRGVVRVAPGDYELSHVTVPAGTSLSGFGATFRRPAFAGSATVTLSLAHAGRQDSPHTLLEGFRIDGRRDEQGAFLDDSQENAHLIHAFADPSTPGRLRVTLESLTLESGVGDGVAFGPNVDGALCRTSCYDLWREAVSVSGGNSRLRSTGLVADASFGTTGVRFSARDPGYGPSSALQVELQDVLLATGDIELDLGADSEVVIRELTMGRGAFSVSAPDSSVRISDSLLMLGIPSERHNHFRVPHDVTITDSTLLLSEQLDEQPTTEEAERTLWFADVAFRATPRAKLEPGDHQLLFDRCQFGLAADVEANDEVFVVRSPADGGSVVVRSGQLGSGIRDWLAPACVGCVIEP